MAVVDASSFARVRIVAPRTRVDVALPNDLALMDLLPSILELVGERAGDVSEAGWVLTSVDGAPVALDKSLDASDIRDGSVLRLRSGLELVDPPLYDDVVDAIAETVQKKVDRRDPVRIIATAVVVAALAGSALLLSQAGGLAAAAAAAVACALCLTISAQAARVARMHHVAVAFASAGVGLGFVAGESLITGAWTWPRMLLGVSVALVAAVVGRLASAAALGSSSSSHTSGRIGPGMTRNEADVRVLGATGRFCCWKSPWQHRDGVWGVRMEPLPAHAGSRWGNSSDFGKWGTGGGKKYVSEREGSGKAAFKG